MLKNHVATGSIKNINDNDNNNDNNSTNTTTPNTTATPHTTSNTPSTPYHNASLTKSPTYSHLEAISLCSKNIRKQNKGVFPGIMNTFAFGYSLDSKLLNEIAIEENGIY